MALGGSVCKLCCAGTARSGSQQFGDVERGVRRGHTGCAAVHRRQVHQAGGGLAVVDLGPQVAQLGHIERAGRVGAVAARAEPTGEFGLEVAVPVADDGEGPAGVGLFLDPGFERGCLRTQGDAVEVAAVHAARGAGRLQVHVQQRQGACRGAGPSHHQLDAAANRAGDGGVVFLAQAAHLAALHRQVGGLAHGKAEVLRVDARGEARHGITRWKHGLQRAGATGFLHREHVHAQCRQFSQALPHRCQFLGRVVLRGGDAVALVDVAEGQVVA